MSKSHQCGITSVSRNLIKLANRPQRRDFAATNNRAGHMNHPFEQECSISIMLADKRPTQQGPNRDLSLTPLGKIQNWRFWVE